MAKDAGASLRLGLFLGGALALAVAESRAPDRPRNLRRRDRWPAAVVMATLAGAVGRVLPPAGLIGAAHWAERRRLGLFRRLRAPTWLAWAGSLVALDLAVWAQHVLSHRDPRFWRLHRVHHTDPEVDVSTGVRFHPAEIALSAAWKSAVVVALGAPAGAALAFEAWLSTGALFSHANLRLSPGLEDTLRRVIVTPQSHRLHHRAAAEQSQVNFGFGLALWDRVFGTYAEGEVGRDALLGFEAGRREARDQGVLTLLRQPLEP